MRCRIKSYWLCTIVLCVCQVGCNKNGSSARQQTQQTTGPENVERATCSKHQLEQNGCGEYRVLSYDATWKNGYGNEGAFLLEREGLTIHAHCGSENCYIWSEAVGKAVFADRSITDLITRYSPDCEDPLFVQNSLEYHKRMTGRDATVAQVCDQTLIVEKVEVKATPKN